MIKPDFKGIESINVSFFRCSRLLKSAFPLANIVGFNSNLYSSTRSSLMRLEAKLAPPQAMIFFPFSFFRRVISAGRSWATLVFFQSGLKSPFVKTICCVLSASFANFNSLGYCPGYVIPIASIQNKWGTFFFPLNRYLLNQGLYTNLSTHHRW